LGLTWKFGLQENEEEDEGPIYMNDADVLEELDVDEEGMLFSICLGF
jgi:hypothetical protein